jgi:hypothetical protein
MAYSSSRSCRSFTVKETLPLRLNLVSHFFLAAKVFTAQKCQSSPSSSDVDQVFFLTNAECDHVSFCSLESFSTGTKGRLFQLNKKVWGCIDSGGMMMMVMMLLHGMSALAHREWKLYALNSACAVTDKTNKGECFLYSKLDFQLRTWLLPLPCCCITTCRSKIQLIWDAVLLLLTGDLHEAQEELPTLSC